MHLNPQLAVQLEDLGRSLELLGMTLCADPVVISSHVGALQEIDRIVQLQLAISAVLAAANQHEACLRSPLERIRRLALEDSLAA